MRRIVTALVVVAYCLLTVHVHAAEHQRNAAVLYLEAFKKMDALPANLVAALHEEEDDGFRALSEDQKKLVESTHDISNLLDRARMEKRCEWDEPFFKNPMSFEPPRWLGSARRVSRLACLRDRYSRELKKNISEGIDEVMRTWTMGRRISRGSTLINGLIQISIDALFIEHLAATLPSMKDVEVESLLTRINALPKADTLQQTAEREMQAVVRWFREDIPKDVDKRVAEWEAMKRQLHGFYSVVEEDDRDFDPLPYRAVGAIAKNDPKRYQEMVDEFEKAYQGHLKIFTVPLDKIDATHAQWKKDINVGNQLIKEIADDKLGVFKNLPRTEHRIVIMHAMLKAGIDYIKGGEEAFAKHKEPVSGESFKLVKDDSGFTVRSSQFSDTENDLFSVRFGKPAK